MKHVQAYLNARKDQFCPMGMSCEAGTSLFICAKHSTSPFSPPRKCCEARAGLLSSRKDVESSFHHCGGPVKLVQACLCVGSTIQRRFQRRRRAVNHVHACGSADKDGETVFTTEQVLCCWCKPVYVQETPYNAVLTAEEVL